MSVCLRCLSACMTRGILRPQWGQHVMSCVINYAFKYSTWKSHMHACRCEMLWRFNLKKTSQVANIVSSLSHLLWSKSPDLYSVVIILMTMAWVTVWHKLGWGQCIYSLIMSRSIEQSSTKAQTSSGIAGSGRHRSHESSSNYINTVVLQSSAWLG